MSFSRNAPTNSWCRMLLTTLAAYPSSCRCKTDATLAHLGMACSAFYLLFNGVREGGRGAGRAQMKEDGVKKLVVLPLYPQFSISTSGSSLRLLEALFKQDPALSGLLHTVIPSWYHRPGYIAAMSDLIQVCVRASPPACSHEGLLRIGKHWNQSRDDRDRDAGRSKESRMELRATEVCCANRPHRQAVATCRYTLPCRQRARNACMQMLRLALH